MHFHLRTSWLRIWISWQHLSRPQVWPAGLNQRSQILARSLHLSWHAPTAKSQPSLHPYHARSHHWSSSRTIVRASAQLVSRGQSNLLKLAWMRKCRLSKERQSFVGGGRFDVSEEARPEIVTERRVHPMFLLQGAYACLFQFLFVLLWFNSPITNLRKQCKTLFKPSTLYVPFDSDHHMFFGQIHSTRCYSNTTACVIVQLIVLITRSVHSALLSTLE